MNKTSFQTKPSIRVKNVLEGFVFISVPMNINNIARVERHSAAVKYNVGGLKHH